MELKKYIGMKIKELRNIKNINQEYLAEALGTTKQSVSRYEKGQRKADQDVLFELADFFGVSIDYFFPLDKDDPNFDELISRLPPHIAEDVKDFLKKIVMLWNTQGEFTEQNIEFFNNNANIIMGRVSAAGSAVEVDDNLAKKEVVSSNMIPKGADELVEITGDSMEPTIHKGDKVYIRHQPDVENGEIAIIRIDDQGVTCKRVYKEDGKLILKSDNDKYEDIVIEKDEAVILAKVLI